MGDDDYTPPEYSILSEEIRALRKKMNGFLGKRFELRDCNSAPSSASSQGLFSSSSSSSNAQPAAPKVPLRNLIILINNTEELVNCDTDKVPQRDAIKKLRSEFQSNLKNIKAEDADKAYQYYLGALLHRYFRIINDYALWKKKAFWSFTTPANCRLFQSIRTALNLTEPDYENDLNSLDILTVVSSLQMFRDSMLSEDQYKKYPHFSDKKTNFVEYLDEIIEQQKNRNRLILNQFLALDFLESLVNHLDAKKKTLDLILKQWCEQLEHDYRDFSQLEEHTIRQHLNEHIEDKQSRASIGMIFNLEVIQHQLSEGIEEHEHFQELMKMGCASILSYILLGGCALVLRSREILGDKKQNSDLRFLINKCLEMNLRHPSDSSQLSALTVMYTYLENSKEAESALKTDCFSYRGMKEFSLLVLKEEQLLTSEMESKGKEKEEEKQPAHTL